MSTETSASTPPDPSSSSSIGVPACDGETAPSIVDLKEVHQILNHTYLSGVYFVLNAVPDMRLLFDGPSCGYDKAFLISGTHDLFSRLFSFPARHRISCTHAQADALVHDRADTIAHVLDQMVGSEPAGLILVGAMPMASITGVDYQAIIDQVAEQSSAPIALVPEKSFRSDWLIGFDDTLCTVVEQVIPHRARSLNREDVAVVGYFFDRNEGDHTGNIAELGRVCEALGLRLVSVWLDGSPTTALARAARAGTIVSLPYGRRAAEALAQRTGAKVLTFDLPIGLAASKEWVLELGAAVGRRWEAKQFVERELEACVPVLDTVMADYVQGRRLSFNGDPFLGEAIMGAFHELGCTTAHAVIFGVADAVKRLARRRFVGEVPTCYCARLSDALELDWSEVDFVIGNSYVHYVVRLRAARKAYLELGYPSYQHHCLSSSPHWFFRGFVNLVNRVVNAL